jgi:hypothetical protein
MAAAAAFSAGVIVTGDGAAARSGRVKATAATRMGLMVSPGKRAPERAET